ncbi:MAG: hypothetical protein ABR584_03940 [Candidatus Baltobacteraceae bacterium]
MKKLVSLATVAALLFGATLPAAAVTATAPVTVHWNTALAATLALTTSYTATGTQSASAPSVLTNNNSGTTGTCAASASAEVGANVTFGTITPDPANNENCTYLNAVNAVVKTNSVNWSLAAQITSAAVAGTSLCAMGNGLTFPVAALSAAAPVTQSSRLAASTAGACTQAPIGTASATTMVSSTTSYPSTAANIGHDLELILTPGATGGTQQYTVTYTLTAN